MHVERVIQRRAERDDLLDQVRLAVRQHFREDAAAAVADDRDARRGLVMHGQQRVDERSEHDLRIHHVECHTGEARAVADTAQPVELGAKSPVAREKAWNQQDWFAQAGRHVVPAKDGIPDQTEELERDAALEPHRRDGIPTPHVAQVGKDGGGNLQPSGAPAMGWF